MLLLMVTFGGLLLMMGHQSRSESLFYCFRLEDQVPENHLLRLIDRHVNFEFIRAKLKDRYSDAGRPSIDLPERKLDMNKRIRRTLCRGVFGIVILCAYACLANAEKQWPVKYLAGSKQSKLGAKLELIVTDESVSCKKGSDIVLDVPVKTIAEVGYDTSSHNRGWTWLKTGTQASAQGSCSGAGSEYCGAADAVLLAPVLVGAAVLSPFASTEHFVRLLWNENGVPSQALFEVGKENYEPLLTELQRVTGRPWQDLPQARKKVFTEIEQAKGQGVPLVLDRNVVLNEAEMKRGRYKVVLLERGDNHGEVYFFNGAEVNPAHVAAQAVVQVQTPKSESTNAQVAYVVQQGVETIQSVQFAQKQLVFAFNALPTRVSNSVRSFYGGSDKWAMVVQTNYHGEPALKFHVVHNPFPHVCQEYLYVTHSLVASEIAPNSPQSSCQTFSRARSEVKAVAQEGKWTNRFLRLTADGKDYNFQPIFEEANGNGKIAMLGKTRDAARDYSVFFVQAVTDFESVMGQTQNEPSPHP